ncbi:histidine kinase [Novosphingobium sp.]|uniref:histidine kinase n=1 Tax=Novosphingobium sp. TaxID=1874826 RepID=UPI0026370B77|nr:histidine kinase [Novosphingobium sp.]
MTALPIDPGIPRVPARQVILSAAALWLCYFVLITVRGLVVELGDFTDLLWRRGLVTMAGIVVTVACWPLLRRFDAKPLVVRGAAALVIMLPAALALAAVNQWAFAPVEKRMLERITTIADDKSAAASDEDRAADGSRVPSVKIRRDMAGNVMVDLLDEGFELPVPPVPPEPSASAVPPPPPETPADAAREAARQKVEAEMLAGEPERRAVIAKAARDAAEIARARAEAEIAAIDAELREAAEKSGKVTVIRQLVEQEGLWRQLTDVALGRYFLLIAWAALYLALGNGEQLRAAEYREGEYRRAAKAAELRSLRYQVNPHFLFNTLNSLSALVMVGRAEQAERMIQSISRFYRHSLAGDPTTDMPLEDEIALQRHYLDIEAVRFPERLVCEFDVPDDLMSACVPGMILQPLVENSIKYGVSATTRPVTIRISAREAGGFLILTVADDGPGEGVESGSTGIGLENVKSRLIARFGDEAKVESGPLPAGGYATVLTMPVVRNIC